MEKSLSKNVSVYLDLLRAGAALIVFTTHVRNFLFPDMKFGPLAFGREAVAIFFVLSGFVISYVVANKETNWRSYAVARLTRIYPVAVITIITTLIADALGTMSNAYHYDEMNKLFPEFYWPFHLTALMSYLTFTNQFWFLHLVVGSNEPYWSLGYEVPFYIFFGLLSYARRKWVIAACLIWAILCGPKILEYLPLWFLGVVCQKYLSQEHLQSKSASTFLFGASLASLVLLKWVMGKSATDMYHLSSISQEAVNFAYFMLLGICVSVSIIAFDGMVKERAFFPGPVVKVIKWLAGGSFTLYLVHQPLAAMFSAFLDPVENKKLLCILAAVCIFIIAMLLAEIGERRKRLYAPIFAGLINPRAPSRPIEPAGIRKPPVI